MKGIAISMVILLVLGVIVLVFALSFLSKASNLPPLPFQSDQARFVRYATCVLAKAVNGCTSDNGGPSPQVQGIVLDTNPTTGQQTTCASTCSGDGAGSANSLTVNVNQPISFTSGQINAYASPEWVCSCSVIEDGTWCLNNIASCAYNAFGGGNAITNACENAKYNAGNCIYAPSGSFGLSCFDVYLYQSSLNYYASGGATPFIEPLTASPKYASGLYVSGTDNSINCQLQAPQQCQIGNVNLQGQIPSCFSNYYGGNLLYSCAFDGPGNYTLTAVDAAGTPAPTCKALAVTTGSFSVPTTCVQHTPSISFTPNSQSGKIGTTINYSLTVTNNDNGCSTENLSLSTICPSDNYNNWGTCSVTPDIVSVPSESSVSNAATLSVTIPSFANPASSPYNVGAIVTNPQWTGCPTLTESCDGSADAKIYVTS